LFTCSFVSFACSLFNLPSGFATEQRNQLNHGGGFFFGAQKEGSAPGLVGGSQANSGEHVGPNLHDVLNWAHKKFYPKGERIEPKNNR